MMWVKNKSKQHNVFRDRSNRMLINTIIDELPFRIQRNDSDLSLARAIKMDANNINQSQNNGLNESAGSSSHH